jgi:hypothetical protein
MIRAGSAQLPCARPRQPERIRIFGSTRPRSAIRRDVDFQGIDDVRLMHGFRLTKLRIQNTQSVYTSDI